MMAPIFYVAPKVFRAAAIYGVLALVPMYFAEVAWGVRGADALTRPELLYGFVGTALCFQAVYWLIAGNPLTYRPLMLVGVFAKLAFGVPVVVLYLVERVGPVTLGFGAIDLVLAILFLHCWRLA